MGSSREKVLLASIPGLREGWKPVTRSFLGAKVWSDVGDLVGRYSCSVQVDLALSALLPPIDCSNCLSGRFLGSKRFCFAS